MEMISSSTAFIYSCFIPMGKRLSLYYIALLLADLEGLRPFGLVLDGTLHGPIIPICGGDCGDHDRPTTVFVTPTRTDESFFFEPQMHRCIFLKVPEAGLTKCFKYFDEAIWLCRA